jgi:hypothetical protein
MRYLLSILFIFLAWTNISGQNRLEGKVTYITSQHVYVRLNSMKDISEGDTLYIRQGDIDVPALQIKNLSSVSCVCVPLLTDVFKVSDDVYAYLKVDIPSEGLEEQASIDATQITEVLEADSSQEDSANKKQLKQEISGRLSLSSYSNFANEEADMSQRMRYTFSMRANNLGNSKLSAESYLSFAHTNSNWEEVMDNIFKGLKIYNLSLKYDFSESMHLSFGRKINPKLSSVGAIDGLQFEKSFRAITVGAIVGSRPDYVDYSVNLDLLQYGIYLGHEYSGKKGNMQSTFAFIEQTNQSMTDRRFAYFQHTNMLIKNLFLFASAEVDLYKIVDDVQETTFDLSNTYLSLRYRIIRPLTVGLSYSNRNPVIYYETYKDFLERLLESEALQGWRFRTTYRPAKNLFIGVNAGYRFRKDDPRPSKNLSGTLTYSHVPGIGASVTLSSTWLETSYINGMVYGAGISRDLVPGKLSGGLKYQYVDYLYVNSEMALIQNVIEANLSWMIYRKLLLSVYYEGTFEKELPYHRLYINISKRF